MNFTLTEYGNLIDGKSISSERRPYGGMMLSTRAGKFRISIERKQLRHITWDNMTLLYFLDQNLEAIVEIERRMKSDEVVLGSAAGYHKENKEEVASWRLSYTTAIVRELGRSVMVDEIKVDPPKATEVRIKMLFASICHTDIVCFDGFPTPLFPRIPGHEGFRMFKSVREDVKTKLKPGDIVLPLLLGECGQCLNCKSGRTNLYLAYPLTFSGLMLDAITSRFSSHVVSPLALVLHGKKLKSLRVLIVTVVALFLAIGAQMQGASKIIEVDVNENKVAKGKTFGMTHFINPKDHPNQSVSDMVTAVVVRELGRSMMVEKIKVDPPKATEVRIKMLFASIFHTDIVCFDGFPTPLFPRIPGHEGVGMVESVEEDIKTKLKPGDIVMPLLLGEYVNENNVAKGKAFGMTNFINPKDHPNQSVSDMVRDITDGLGVDYCFECTGIASLLKEIIG
ncbi:alcohol dehydrogenase-like 1 protein [Tanacetum coccineum]